MTIAEALSERGAVLFGSNDLAAVAQMTNAQRMVHYVAKVLAYVESIDYGEVTNYE